MMGCCFSKEAGPDRNSEKSSLLHTPHRDHIHNGVEQVRHQAVAVAQHVSLDEEEDSGAARAEGRPGLDHQARTVVSEKTVQAPSSHKEERAILIPVGASVIPDSSAGVTLSRLRNCEPAAYMEVLSQSLTGQNIVANATRRAQWFTQNLEGQKLPHPEDYRSGSSGTKGDSCGKVPRDLTLSSVSHQDRVSLIGEDCIVTTTLGQDFQTRTRRFYSICSIDTNDLDHDDHNQTRESGTCAGGQTTSPLLNQPLNSAPLTAASGIIPELQVDPHVPRGIPEGNEPSKAEGDHPMLTEQSASSIQASEEIQLDHIRRSQPASESPKEARSFPKPDVTEQQSDEEDQSSILREDGVPANKSQEDEVIRQNATLTQLTPAPLILTSVVELKTPGLDDEDDSCDRTTFTEEEPSMSRTSKQTPAIFRENQLDHVQRSHPTIDSPKEFHSCPESDITESQIEGEDKCSSRGEDDVPERESVECLGLTDEEDSCDGMMLLEQSASSELQTWRKKNAIFQENSQHAGDNLKEVPRSRLSCGPESNVTEQHDECQEDAPEDKLIHGNPTHSQVSFPGVLSTSPQQCGNGEGTARDNEDMRAKVSLAAFSEPDASSRRSHESDPPEPTNGSLRGEEETVPLEHPKTPPHAFSDAETVDVGRPDEISRHLRDLGVQVEFDQLDLHALTPSYEILGREAPGEESDMRDLVSELLGGDADASVHQTWIGPAVEDPCQAWVQGAPQSPDEMVPHWAWHTGCPEAPLGSSQTLNPDAEVWTGSNYNLPQARQPWLQLPDERVDPQSHALHTELGYIGVGVTEVEDQPKATENHILPEPDSGELMEQLRSTLDCCLSRDYLASDLYLQSRMDDEQYVPIAALAGLHAIKCLGADLQLVTDVVKTVPQVQMSPCGHKVRANPIRYVLILREIPSSTPREERPVEALFSDKKLPKFLSCEVVSGDYWFVTFGSEADAYQAYVYLREEVRLFQGKPIKVRMKAKSTTPTSHIPGNGFCPNVEPSYLPPDAYQQLYDFTYPVWSDSGYSDGAEPLELSGALNGLQASPYFQHHVARRKRNGARTSGWYQIGHQKNSDDLAGKSSVEMSNASRPARGWSHSRGNRPRHSRCYDSLTGGHTGRSVNDDQRRRKKLWAALKTAGVHHTKPATPRQSSPIQLVASDFPPLGVEKTPEPAQPLTTTTAADDIAHEATQKLSYAAICQKSSSGRPAPPVEEK
ncbi:uncharacterized protein LOC127593450 [Hippocampus zosterae]|uniref:uncharacterized protein LOC127593450 n=1 Tax=Hippocampus zosterae TaxID=109293 RepID=UPI00223D93A0|nr:uncharacterized protein LOC127593450 [Hippocampus zosterae]